MQGYRPDSQIPQFTRQISHNASSCNGNVLLQNGALRDMGLVHYWICVTYLLRSSIMWNGRTGGQGHWLGKIWTHETPHFHRSQFLLTEIRKKYNLVFYTDVRKVRLDAVSWLHNNSSVIIATLCLTHWGRVTHICVDIENIICSDNGLSPCRRQAIIWTNAGILLIRSLGTNFNEISIGIHTFSFKKINFK